MKQACNLVTGYSPLGRVMPLKIEFKGNSKGQGTCALTIYTDIILPPPGWHNSARTRVVCYD